MAKTVRIIDVYGRSSKAFGAERVFAKKPLEYELWKCVWSEPLPPGPFEI